MFDKIDRNTLYFGALIIGIIAIYYFMYVHEGFSPCENLKNTHQIVINTMDNIDLQTGDTRDNINNTINYRDMQTRDIVLNDEKTSWCANLSSKDKETVLKTIADNLDTEVELFDGLLIDKNEKKSNDDGIMYNGTDAAEDYAKA